MPHSGWRQIPQDPPYEVRTHLTSLRMTPAMRDRIAEVARFLEVSPQTLMRAAIREYIGDKPAPGFVGGPRQETK